MRQRLCWQKSRDGEKRVKVRGSWSMHVEAAIEQLHDDVRQIVSSQTALSVLTMSGLVFQLSLTQSGSSVSLCLDMNQQLNSLSATDIFCR